MLDSWRDLYYIVEAHPWHCQHRRGRGVDEDLPAALLQVRKSGVGWMHCAPEVHVLQHQNISVSWKEMIQKYKLQYVE